MGSSEVERPGRLTLEIGPYSASVLSIAATVVFVVVTVLLAKSTMTNNARADDWQKRAVAAEEIVGGLRVVIAQRSKALNERTRQANLLASSLDTRGEALRRSKTSLGSLTREQERLETERARATAQLQKLRVRHSTLSSVAVKLNTCSEGLAALLGGPKPKPAVRDARLAQCSRARASFQGYLRDAG